MNERKKITDFYVGESASLTQTVTEDMVNQMAELTGDRNPVHLDDAYAANTTFGKRIAHGLFCVGMVSNLLGTSLPGEGTILLNEEIRYCKPVYLGDTVEARVEITEIHLEKRRIQLSFVCVNQSQQVVCEGRAKIFYSGS